MTRDHELSDVPSDVVVDPIDERADAARPLRAWFGGGCSGAEPVPGLTAALTSGTDGPFVLTGDELDYFSQLFGDATPFHEPVLRGVSRRPSEVRDSLLERGFVLDDPSKSGPFAVVLAPNYLASIGVAFLAPRSTAVSVAVAGRTDDRVLVRNQERAVMLEVCDDDGVRFRVTSPDDGLRELVRAIPRDIPGEPGDAVDVSEEDWERYIERGADAGVAAAPALAVLRDDSAEPNWASTTIVDCSARAPFWSPLSTHASFTVRGRATWLDARGAAPGRVRFERIDADRVTAIVSEYCGEPGPASELWADKEARGAAARAEQAAAVGRAWRHRSPWRQAARTLDALDWMARMMRAPFPPYYARQGPRTAAVVPPPPPPPVRGLTPDA